MKNTEADLKHAERSASYYKSEATKMLRGKADALRRAADAVDRYATRMVEGDEHSTMKVTDEDLFSWAINEIENAIRNFNFSQMATAGMRMAQANAEVALLKQS